ncbi:terminase [soil metagenome]
MSLSSTLTAVAHSPAERLATLPAGRPEFTLGEVAAAWCHRVLRQPNGPRARMPFRLSFDQYRFLLWFYAVDRDGRWLFNHGVRRLAKGSGKSPFAAVLALIELCAPVRLARFDDRVPGGVRGRPVDMPLVQIAATAETQTQNTMRMVRAFAPKGSTVVREYSLDPGKTRYYKVPEGTLEIITSSATAAEGVEASFVVGDETELWTPSNGGPDLASTLADNLAKSGARMLETANAWRPGVSSVAESTWEDWLAQEEGRLRGDARILYDARMAPPDTDMADVDSLRVALEWVYGDCDWKRPTPDGPPDVRPLMERIWRKSAKPDDSKRKYLNWPTAALDAWTTPEMWARLATLQRPVADGDEVVLFFDGSKSRDATALVGCRLDDGYVFTVDVWEPNPHDPDDTVDVAMVDLAVLRTFARFKVVAFFADVREWESFVLSSWPQAYGVDLMVQAAPNARPPQPIAWDMRGHVYEFAKAAEACEAEIKDGAFAHDGDSRTARHIGNCRRRVYRDAFTVGKESKDSPLKIDAAVCVIGVRMLRRIVLLSPEYTRLRSKQEGQFVPRRIR